MTDEVALAALGEVLSRRCWSTQQRDDAESAQRIIDEIARSDIDKTVLVALLGGVRAAFLPDELTDELAEAAATSARQLMPTRLADTERLAVAAALGVLADSGRPARRTADFVAVALSAHHIEQDQLGRWAAERALAAADDLTPSQETAAAFVLALISQDRADILRAYELAATLPPDDPRARQAERLRATLHPDLPSQLEPAGDAVRAGNREAAARSLAEDFGRLHDETGNPVVGGLAEAMAALGEREVDVEAARRGLTTVVRALRSRQRYGQVPAVARTGIDMIASMLTIDATAATADLLAEFLEALADAGLSDIVLDEHLDVLPALVQARFADVASALPTWPDLAGCVHGLRGRPALLLRRQRMFATKNASVLSMYVEPPDSVAIKSTLLTDADAAVLRRFGRARPAELRATDLREVNRLISSLLPAALLERLADAGRQPIVIVPDGELWSLPWQAAPVFDDVTVALTPSLSVHARLAPTSGVVRTVVTLIDPGVEGADEVSAALEAAQRSGTLTVAHYSPGVTQTCDLLLVFAHGEGTGLSFRTGTAAQPVPALQVATEVKAGAAVVAACRALAAPPVSFPITLPSAMLLSGFSTVIGGLWLLPAEPTARIVADLIHRLASGTELVTALTAARASVPDLLDQRWGLAVHGLT
ncbi:hypothetical protein AMES_5715 [Amycolatopsis mediterranei S699]|uniref:CHAT domain-containing protein n=3 Tax=Amycolatopsis mediterranei TaxID=33910 RepID=A0A0H3D954_AMYMU|nr:CHAT domain-containing protein [Amycolatopsis mediterranei]ADJ47540.1 hypothetical protein AMED_5793 [Amycolatopsis mediterranei U32]AEK44405.1 hypothetical protein RAM_29650 [Amycolatopsis mediterranei S699]AFO79251.1 hypothetical protein AMES_5715 [Amycolatopsis mediterranei S699]AGT86379.1 hypothetical protein B737_5715 [Amycolatopsis mediterranei RB]KDO12828.1 hypothetical protein DV26_00105 [Amycolatopsis mediterranei]